MSRSEHLQWAKARALEYLNRGDLGQALSSMVSDLNKHDEIGCPPVLGQLGMMTAMQGDHEGMRRWIEGFN